MKEGFEHHLRQRLHREEAQIDAQTLRKLAAVREQALAAPASRWHLRRFAMPTAGIFVVSLALLLLVAPATDTASVSEQNLSLNNLQLYEDLDFYSWLADEQTGAAD